MAAISINSRSIRRASTWETFYGGYKRTPTGWEPVPPRPVYYVATTGSNGNPGTESQPWGTIDYAVRQLSEGDTLLVRGGTYTERIQSPTINIGTRWKPITMKAYPGETPFIKGLFWMTGPTWWVFDGINVEWNDATGSAGEHMVKMTNGTRWVFKNAEVRNARSFAAMLIAGDASYWHVTECYFHHTYQANDTNQDHLLYTNSTGLRGRITHNLMHTSPNGRAIKVGPPSKGAGDTNQLEIAYNSMYDNLGPSNIQLAWEVSNVDIHHNIMDTPDAGRSCVTAFDMTVGESGNIVRNNVWWNAPRVSDEDPSITIEANNPNLDPQWANINTIDMAPTNPAVVGTYGHTAPVVDTPVRVSQISADSVVTFETAQVSGVWVDSELVINTADWLVDAAGVSNGNTLTDLSGNARDGAFGTLTNSPTMLYYDGSTNYLHIPSASQGVQITTTAALPFTATRTDDTTFTGTTANGSWLFDEIGDWKDIRTDNNAYIVDFANPSANYTTVANSGSSGGDWSIVRAADGAKTAFVNRPLILFDNTQGQFITTSSVPQSAQQTLVAVWRTFGTNTGTWTFLDTDINANDSGRTNMYRTTASTGFSIAARQTDATTITDGYSVGSDWDGEHSYAGRFTQSEIEAFYDGDTLNTPVSLTAAPALWGSDGVYIGGSYNSDISGEFIGAAVFTRALTDAEILRAGSEISKQWIDLPLPVAPVDPPLWSQDFESFAVDQEIVSSPEFNGDFEVWVRSVDGSKVMSVEPAGTSAANVIKNLAISNVFSMTFDFYLTAWPTGLQQIVWSETSGDLPRLYLDNSPQGLYARVLNSTTLIPVSLNTWYSIELSHDGSTVSLSVTPRAGGSTVTETIADTTTWSITRFRFGHRYGNLSDRFYMDNIVVRDTV